MQQALQLALGRQVVLSLEQPTDHGEWTVREHRRAVAAEPQVQESLACVGLRMHRPESGIDRSDTRPDEKIGDYAAARHHVDDSNLESAEGGAATQDHGEPGFHYP
ncbi:MAG TPA: hypothetical protein VFR33_14895 [Candidatus Dormibacteraeota bacterium]|nr:hypothetical protein [Candidatus Dormibacteraeota bacterium]